MPLRIADTLYRIGQDGHRELLYAHGHPIDDRIIRIAYEKAAEWISAIEDDGQGFHAGRRIFMDTAYAWYGQAGGKHSGATLESA